MYVLKSAYNDSFIYYVDTEENNQFGLDLSSFSFPIENAKVFTNKDIADKTSKDLNKRFDPLYFNVVGVCPSCNKDYEGYSAISRRDNKTHICSECGMHEALAEFTKYNKN